ncbi:hypothetical protein AALA52_08230 [Lactococcus ileimucosae]|uniref:DUF6273 domain-containing protein n=1 Tax=Lactococcus ileimucosae TaxID=2941329 RepID=A0ABV4D5T3_9LACT
MIIRNRVIPGVTFEGQEARLDLWYSQLESSVQSIVRPVVDNFITGNVVHEDIIFEGPGERWQASNLQNFLVVASDLSQSDSSGTSKAFALSLADVTHLSGPGRAFPNHDERGALSIGDTVSWWWLRTPGDTGLGWFVSGSMRGELFGTRPVGTTHSTGGGIRPALIINQPL